jgi:hypothetical protein
MLVATSIANCSDADARLGFTASATQQDVEVRAIEVEAAAVGAIIGRGGTTIRDLQAQSGARLQVDRAEDGCKPAVVRISGTAEQVTAAQKLLSVLLRRGSWSASEVGAASAASDGLDLRAHPLSWLLKEASAADLRYVIEELAISDEALSALLNPAMPGPLAQLQQARGLTVHFSRFRRSGVAATTFDLLDSSSVGAGEGSRIVRLGGPAALVSYGRSLLEGAEAQWKAALTAKANESLRSLAPDEALYRYYHRYYEQAGLPYTPPAKLWQDEVDAEAARYKMWASYYAGPAGALDTQLVSNAAAAALAAASAAATGIAAADPSATGMPQDAHAGAHATSSLGLSLVQDASMSSSTLVLPGGWIEQKDAISGRTYYSNLALGQTQWERPVG